MTTKADVERAEELRAQREDLLLVLDELEKDREGLDPAGKRSNTRRRNHIKGLLKPIEKELEDAPLPPTEPHVALRMLRKRLLEEVNRFKVEKAEFLSLLDKHLFSPSHELDWRSGPLIELEQGARAAYYFLKVSYDTGGTDFQKLQATHEAVSQWVEEETDRVMREVKSTIGRSSSKFHNAVEDHKFAGLANVIDDYSRWGWSTYVRMLECAKNWTLLHGDN